MSDQDSDDEGKPLETSSETPTYHILPKHKSAALSHLLFFYNPAFVPLSRGGRRGVKYLSEKR